MATVIEVLNKKGEVISYERFDQDRVSIGRSYENDLRLADETIDAKHLEISLNEDGTFRVVDQGTVNGSLLVKKSAKPKTVLSILDIHSGDEIKLGHSRIRVVDSTIAVSKAQKIVPDNGWVVWLKKPLVVIGLLILSLLNLMYQDYSTKIVEIEAADYVMSFFQAGAGVLVVCLMLSLLAKAVRHQWLFIENLVNVCLFILVLDIGRELLDILIFNFGYWYSKELLDAVILFSVALMGAWIITFNVFTEKRMLRIGMVTAFAGLVLTYNLVKNYSDDKEFDKIRPVVTDKYKSWVLVPNSPVTDAQFINDSVMIFENTPKNDTD